MRTRTLAGLLRARADACGDQLAVRFKEGGDWVEWTWARYWSAARTAAAALHAHGVRPGDRLLLVVPEVRLAVTALFGAWVLGATPTVLGVPYPLPQPGGFLRQAHQLARRLGARAVVLSPGLADHAETGEGPDFLAADGLSAAAGGALPDPEDPLGPALIQLTSGSTGHPRGVVVPHDRLLLHLQSMSEALPSRADSMAVSWLPLHHDMGLLGGLLFPFYNNFPAHLLSPLDFRTRPMCWLEAMSRFRGTICAAPPSAYALCVPLGRRAAAARLDLRAWECAMVGAEPIPAQVLRDFARAFAPAGFRAEAFFPVYGLAEATVAVTFPRLLAPTRFDCIDRPALERTSQAVPCESGPHELELVGVGSPIPHTAVSIADEVGRDLPERAVGEILVRSATLMQGYHDEPAATATALTGGWLHTGDLGYLAGGSLFVTGRKKDLIIKGGHNLTPVALEEIAGAVEGVRPGGVAAVGVRNEVRATEVVVVVVETRLPTPEHPLLAARVRDRLRDHGILIDQVLLVPPRSLPRTTSGKLCRAAVAEALAAGQGPLSEPPHLQED